MARAGGHRPRARSAVFGAYVLLVILIAYLFSDRLTAFWYNAGWVRWYVTAYVVVDAVVLVGLCLGAVAWAGRLDERVTELEARGRVVLLEAPAVPSHREEAASPSEPTDQDVEQLLVELYSLGEATEAFAEPVEEVPAAARAPVRAAAALRSADWERIRRHRRVRATVAARAAGPAVVCVAFLGLFAPLLPAADGLLPASPVLARFLALAGLAYLVGLVPFAAGAFRGLGTHGP